MVFYRNQRFHSWRSRGWAAAAGGGWGAKKREGEEQKGKEGKGGGEVVNTESGLDTP